VRSLLARLDRRVVRIAAFAVAGLVAVSAVAFAVVRDDDPRKPTTVAVRDDSSTTSTPDDRDPLVVESTTSSSTAVAESTTTSTTVKPTTTTTAAPAPVRYPTGPASPIATGGLYVVAIADGVPHSIASDLSMDRATWSTDGRRVLYGGHGLKSVYPDGTSPTSYSVPGAILTPEWSSRGQFATILLEQGNAYHLGLTQRSGALRTIRNTQVGEVSGVGWSPDGSRVVFTAGGRVWIANADASGLHAVTPAGGKAWRWVTWSPDGARIAFYEGGKLRVMKVDGTGLHDVAAVAENEPAWSPDGQWLVVTGTDTAVGIVSANGGAVRPLGVKGFNPSWSPDGRTIAIPGGHAVQLVQADGTGLRTLLSTSSDNWFGVGTMWSPDSTHLLLNTGGYEGGPGEPR
jgi:WD40 repeat protein